MLNQKRGNHFTNAPTMTRGGFLKGILASGIAPSITLATLAKVGSANASVGGMMRNVGARLSLMSGTSIPDWWTPLLSATWPNNTAFDEYESDTENYNDIYATYPMAS